MLILLRREIRTRHLLMLAGEIADLTGLWASLIAWSGVSGVIGIEVA